MCCRNNEVIYALVICDKIQYMQFCIGRIAVNFRKQEVACAINIIN